MANSIQSIQLGAKNNEFSPSEGRLHKFKNPLLVNFTSIRLLKTEYPLPKESTLQKFSSQ
jgi:hypothetical protein